MILICLALLQSATPTVGDTVWLETTTPVPPGHLVRLPSWEPSGDMELLGTPRLVESGDSVTVRYPMVVWRPGTHAVTIPGAEFIAPDGTVASAPDREVTLQVASVLPDAPPEEIPIKAESGIVQRPITSWIPLALLLLLALALAAPLWWWWLRRGPSTPPPPDEPDLPELPIEQWSSAGENRAVLAAASDTLRHGLEQQLDEIPPAGETEAWVAAVERKNDAPWDGAVVAKLLRDIDRARFRPGDPGAVIDLYRRSLEVANARPEEDGQ